VSAPWPRARTLRFDAPLSTGAFHPRNAGILLLTLTCNEVVLVDLRGAPASEGGTRWVLVDEMEGDEEAPKKSALTCATWSPCGSRIYAGTNGGMVLVIDPVSRLVQSRIKVGTSGIKQLAFDGAGRNLILNSTDRALRVLTVSPQTGALAPIHRFQDLVNRTPWHAVGFSGDGEYVFGGAGHKMSHNVFVWDREAGALVKVLEGPKESLMDADVSGWSVRGRREPAQRYRYS
jgi:COMPASS component SWD1